jgi:quercetin dioxygenase-like cupin family protein
LIRRCVVAKAGDEIVNPRTGQRIVFIETGDENGGRRVQIGSYNPPSPPLEPEHVHPFQESGVRVNSGFLRFRINGEERSVGPGESVTIPAGVPHHFWNDGHEEAHSVQWFRPALKTDRFFESLFGLAQDGKLNEKGLPPLLQLAVMVPFFGDEVRLTSPPWAVQRVVFGALAPFGRLLGYREQYPYPYGGPDRSSRREDQRPAASRATGGMVTAAVLAIFFALFLLRRRSLSKIE